MLQYSELRSVTAGVVFLCFCSHADLKSLIFVWSLLWTVLYCLNIQSLARYMVLVWTPTAATVTRSSGISKLLVFAVTILLLFSGRGVEHVLEKAETKQDRSGRVSN
jgi:hypothetical protein